MRNIDIKLTVIEIPDEKARKYQIKNLVAEMVCDYLKSSKNHKKNTAHSKRIEQVLQKTRKIIDHQSELSDIA